MTDNFKFSIELKTGHTMFLEIEITKQLSSNVWLSVLKIEIKEPKKINEKERNPNFYHTEEVGQMTQKWGMNQEILQ